MNQTKQINLPNNGGVDLYVDNQLQKWARWYFAVLTDGLGYPRRSIEGALLDGGGVLIASTRGRALPTNEDAERIDKLLCELAQYRPELAVAIKIRYTARKIKTSLSSINLSATTYKKNLAEARAWLAGHLAATARHYYQQPALNQAIANSD